MAITIPSADKRAQALESIRQSQARMVQLREKTLAHTTQLGKTAEKLRARQSAR